MRRAKVVVTGAGALLGQGIIRSLLDGAYPVDIVAADPSPLSAALYWVSERRLLPMAKDPRYLSAIEDLLRAERPDALLVGTDVELEILAVHRADLEQRFSTHIIVSSPEVVRIADDKYKTFQFMRDNGFDAPASCLPGEQDALIAAVGFPLIVKPRIGARSVGVHKVKNFAELDQALRNVEGAVIQECVAGDSDEYTAGTLCFDGKCSASIVMRRDLRDGNTYRAFVDHYPELNVVVRKMAERLGSYGPANFQFRLDGDKVKVFEINGRFSGTTPLRMRAGFNEVEMTLRHVLDGTPIVQPLIEQVTILRHWSETVVRSTDIMGAH